MMERSLLFKGIFLLLVGLCMISTGCATLKSWIVGDDAKAKVAAEKKEEPKDNYTKFSDTPSVLNPSNRQYRKMTKSRMEEESDLGSQAGSMWVMEGQGAYLFSQNKSRREGDLLNIKMEGAAQKQVDTKVSVIKKLLKQLEEDELKAQQPAQPALAEGAAPANPDNKTQAAAAAPARAPAAVEKKDEAKDEPLDIGNVPTRIVERLADGNYRIKGSQPFMIGKREYKVIVTGLIRPEDFNDEGVSSSKILDPQFDVVSIRRSQTQ